MIEQILEHISQLNAAFLMIILENITFVLSTITLPLLVLLGGFINKSFYKQIKKFNIPTRCTLFVIFAAFGFTVINIMAENLIKDIMSTVMNYNQSYGTVVVLCLYVFVGFLAEKFKYGTK